MTTQEVKTAKARARAIRVSPRKLNLLAASIRGLKADKALAQLTFSKKRVSEEVKKVLQSAIANAENNFGMDIDALVVSEAYVGKAMVMKRFAAAAKGRACRIIKSFSNLTIIVAEGEKTLAKSKKSAKIENSEKKTAAKKQVSKKKENN
ncbi:MAG: 50S ribosomal protein L22 [Alphaproteobacteria bacterium]|nr:50S ribosomal protein L22 [Alphaproteobacteria bacterium]